MTGSNQRRLADLRNVGKAMLADFEMLGIASVDDLAAHEPAALYERLIELTGQRQDPCVLDVFAAAIHEARTGQRLDWWVFSRARKAAMAKTR